VAMSLIAQSLHHVGLAVDIATTDDDGPGRRVHGETGDFGRQEFCRVIRFPKQTEFYKFSWPLVAWLREHVTQYDIVHVHALFSFPSIAGAWAARRASVPYVVRPLGVLNHYGMQNRRALLKRASMAFVEGPLLRDAAAVHFTSEAEFREACAWQRVPNAVLIPLGVMGEPRKSGKRSEEKIILFLSRLDPKKNVEVLLRAWASTEAYFGQWRLVVAGDGESNYVSGLKSLVEQLGVSERVAWVGRVEGEQKKHILDSASVFVLPSSSENFGLAAAEAMLAGKACIFTKGVAVGEVAAQAGCAMLVEGTVQGVASGLRELMLNEPARCALAEKAQAFAEKEFSLEVMGERLRRLYEGILCAG